MTRGRLIGLAGCLIAIAVAAALALRGGDAAPVVGEDAAPASASGARTASAPAATTTAAAPAPQPTRTAPRSRPAAAPARAARLPVAADRAAARLLLVGFGGTRVPRRLAARHDWGGVVLEPGNGVSPQQVADLVGRLRSAARRAGHQPPLVAASQLGGELDAVPVGAALQSAAPDAAGARASALAVARALHPLGIRMVLAPDADIGFAGGPWEGVAFSDDPKAVSAMTAAAVSGFKDGEVAPAPGHFPGEGAASGDPALEAATVGLSLPELRGRDLKPFAAIAKHAPAVQLSAATYVAFDGVTPATLLPGVVRLLRGELGFGGVVVSGDLAAASLAGGRPVADLAVQAVKAGVDLLWIPGDVADQDAAYRALVRALRTGEIPAARVADALRRIDALRSAYGVR
jgi:beta-N-acetylhexosaminidase